MPIFGDPIRETIDIFSSKCLFPSNRKDIKREALEVTLTSNIAIILLP